jgi:hypothetical protein
VVAALDGVAAVLGVPDESVLPPADELSPDEASEVEVVLLDELEPDRLSVL